MTPEQKRLDTVLKRMLKLNADDPDFSVDFNDFLNEDLETLAQDDYFGTERQNDPRGDGRDDEWSMDYVQGVDP